MPSRTILKKNLYMDILGLSKSCKYVADMILSLSARYLTEVGNEYNQIALEYENRSLDAFKAALIPHSSRPETITMILAVVVLILQKQVRSSCFRVGYN